MISPRRTVELLTLATAGALLCAGPAAAGRVFLGGHASINDLEAPRLPPGTPASSLRVERRGGGADIQIGYLLAPTVPLRLSLGSSNHESSDARTDFSDGHALLEINRRWNTGGAAQPYLLAGLGAIIFHPTWNHPDIRTTGAMATAGAGVIRRLSRRFSIDLNARVEFINWSNERSVIENLDGSTVTYESSIARRGHGGRFSIGVLWWP